jgi:hypothetical protein
MPVPTQSQIPTIPLKTQQKLAVPDYSLIDSVAVGRFVVTITRFNLSLCALTRLRAEIVLLARAKHDYVEDCGFAPPDPAEECSRG